MIRILGYSMINVLLFSLLFSCGRGYGYGESRRYMRAFTKIKVDEEQLAKLKQTTTLFVLRDQDYDRREEFQEAIRKVWTFTEIDFIFIDELSNSFDGLYSYFLLDGSVRRGTTFIDQISLALELVYPDFTENRRGEIRDESPHFGKIYLQLEDDYEAELLTSNIDSIGESLYRNSQILNWTPQLLATYLSEINEELENESLRFNQYFNLVDTENQSVLARDTLYILDYLYSDRQINPFDIKPEKEFKRYKGHYRFVSAEELDRLISSDQDILFLEAGAIVGDIRYSRIWSTEYGILRSVMYFGGKGKILPKIMGFSWKRG